jgi:D-arabinose 1-dehydrogenase-like Zn-dependent alcohol dehydrogenase
MITVALVFAAIFLRRSSDAEILKAGGNLVSTLYAADEQWFAERKMTAHNIASNKNPLSSPQGLNELARMLADGAISARIRSTVELNGVAEMLEKLRHGGLRGKAVIYPTAGRA